MKKIIVIVGIMGAGQVFAPGANTSVRAADETGDSIAVEVVQPSRRPMVRALQMPATLIPDEQVDLLSKVSGYVARINVDIGSRVHEGDELLTISVPEMADEVRQAEAELKTGQAKVRALEAKAAQAQRQIETARARVRRYAAEHELGRINLTRKQELYEGSAVPEQALDEARSAHAIAEARLQIARAQVAGARAEKQSVEAAIEVAESDVMVARAKLARRRTLVAYASIKAPFDGVITVRSVDHGAFVRSAAEGAATPLVRIAKTDRIRIVLEIPEVDAPYLRLGTEVEIDVKALKRPPLAGVVARIAGALKPETRTMRSEIDLDNADGRFAPGMYAQVTVKLESKQQAMVIPSKAIRTQGTETVVLLSTDGVAKVRPVKIGYDDGIWAEILSGLEGTELVITSTGGAVAPGAAVRPLAIGSG